MLEITYDLFSLFLCHLVFDLFETFFNPPPRFEQWHCFLLPWALLPPSTCNRMNKQNLLSIIVYWRNFQIFQWQKIEEGLHTFGFFLIILVFGFFFFFDNSFSNVIKSLLRLARRKSRDMSF